MTIDVVVETPKGSAQKYAYVPGTPFFRMKKILPSGMVFPYDFGFIPDTKGQDGDPLDVIVISEFCSAPGIVIKCRLIGGFAGRQGRKGKPKERNDRFLAIPKFSSIFSKVRSVADLPKEILKDLEAFFIDYNRLEGRSYKVVKLLKPRDAEADIEAGRK